MRAADAADATCKTCKRALVPHPDRAVWFCPVCRLRTGTEYTAHLVAARVREH